MQENTSTILLIDDSLDIHGLVEVALSEEDLTLYSAYDGTTGLAMARQVKPDVILLDIDMPVQDGFAVCRALKAENSLADVPVLFLTGATLTADKVRGFELGAQDYVTKPFHPAELCSRVRATLRTRRLTQQLAADAKVDALTGLWNRGYFDTLLNQEIATARQNSWPLSCIMADIDRFKSLNDTYGHHFGDQVLRAVANVLRTGCRSTDFPCRYGGEEFIIVMPKASVADAAAVADELRLAVERLEFRHRESIVHVTSSFGVAGLGTDIPPSVVELADKALYRAKQTGRNCVQSCISLSEAA
jgi:two-component system, cell cycle response regulator